MLRVTIDLIPHGVEEQKKTLTYFEIANDGTGTSARGNYKARMNPRNSWTEKVVENYARNAYPVTKLVYLVLKKLYEK